ncbi:MAG: hypothetical protein AAGU75_14090, partial [Bacillota bacterium]
MLKIFRLASFFILFITFVSSCSITSDANSTVTPTSQSRITPSRTPAFTTTPSATFTPSQTVFIRRTRTPTLTPNYTATTIPSSNGPFPTQGPYLVHADMDRQVLILIGAEGRGRREIPIPGHTWSLCIPDAVSPDGKWLAYYQVYKNPTYYETIGDYSLILVNIKEGTSQVIAVLFPEGVEKPEEQEVSLSTRGPEWSPDGRYLAFPGAMDGVAMNLYIYDTTLQTTRRVFQEAISIDRLDWSLDGNWIWIDDNTYSEKGYYLGTDYYVIDPDLPDFQTPRLFKETPYVVERGWIAPDLYLLGKIEEPGGERPLQYLYTL